MPKVLTTAATIMCPHGGTVALVPGGAKLTVQGSEVLRAGDLMGADIAGCTTPSSNTSKPCLKVIAEIGGAATKLTVGGKRALLETVAGTTDGIVGPATMFPLIVQTAGQSKLDAI